MIMNRLMKRLFFLFFLLSLAVILDSQEGMAWDDEMCSPSNPASSGADPGFKPGMWLVSLYRNHISEVDGDRCPSIPSCSSYALESFKKHGLLMGWLMTVDRLIHEGREETLVSPLVYSNGEWKIFDPVENNDFWWFPMDRKHDE